VTSDPQRRGEPRIDRPPTNADPAEVRRKLALLDEPHILPLSDFVSSRRRFNTPSRSSSQRDRDGKSGLPSAPY
jgi:hypothetical protein